MRIARKTTFIKNELPYKVLIHLYENSRSSFRDLGRSFNISYHTISNIIRELEERYTLVYTLQLDEKALGFTEGRLITIKFKIRPDFATLKERFSKDSYVQNAYICEGDFDLLMYVVGLSSKDFQTWQFNLRTDLSEYLPIVKFSTLNYCPTGFFPLRNELISKENPILSKIERNVLTLLNNNSRIKMKDLIKKSKSTDMKVTYAIRKLKDKGIIKKFSALTQKPDKRILYAYSIVITPKKVHKNLNLEFVKELLEEDKHKITNDYCLIANTNGAYDGFYICNFENGEILSKRGSEFIQKLWAEETPIIEKAFLTDLIIGKWPFHLEEYEVYKHITEKET